MKHQVALHRADSFWHKHEGDLGTPRVRVNGKVLEKGWPHIVTSRKDGYIEGIFLKFCYSTYMTERQWKPFKVKDLGTKFVRNGGSSSFAFYFSDITECELPLEELKTLLETEAKIR